MTAGELDAEAERLLRERMGLGTPNMGPTWRQRARGINRARLEAIDRESARRRG